MENLDPSDPQSKFDALAQGVVTNLASPDIVALEEIQDNNGAKNDGTVDASATVKKFTDAIAAAGGPAYQWRSIDPENDKDGGEPGGNIRQGFLFNPARVSFTDRPGGDYKTAVGVTGTKGHPALTLSPGRVDPANPAWTDSRKPLAGEFVFKGRTVFVIANHFASKGGDESLVSQHQPVPRSSEDQAAPAGAGRQRLREAAARGRQARGRPGRSATSTTSTSRARPRPWRTAARCARPTAPCRRRSATPTSTRATPRSSTRS